MRSWKTPKLSVQAAAPEAKSNSKEKLFHILPKKLYINVRETSIFTTLSHYGTVWIRQTYFLIMNIYPQLNQLGICNWFEIY